MIIFRFLFPLLSLSLWFPWSAIGQQDANRVDFEVEVEDAPPPPSAVAGASQAGPKQNFNLPCLAPVLKGIDADVPKTLDQALLSASVRKTQAWPDVAAQAVNFSITANSREVQDLFNRGVALLHSFWYREAQQAFRQAHSLEPENPMPLWGLAWANEQRPQRARLFAHQAQVQMRGAISQRERRWLAAQANYFGVDRTTPLADSSPVEADAATRSRDRVRDLERIATEFPDDFEARAFLIRELVVASYRSGVAPGSRLAIDEMVSNLLSRAPGHPASVYPILLWLSEQPNQAVRAAGVINAPGVPDVWRYAAQAYLEAGEPGPAVELLEAGLRVDHRYLNQRLMTPEQSQGLIGNHALLVRTLAGMGRIDEALTRAREMVHFPDHAALMVALGSNRPLPPGGRRMGFDLYVQSLARVGLWNRMAEDLDQVTELQPDYQALPKAHWIFWKALAGIHQDVEAGSIKVLRDELAGLSGKAGRSQAATEEISSLLAALDVASTLASVARTSAEELATMVEVLERFVPAEAVARLLAASEKTDTALEIIAAAREQEPGSFVTTASYIALHHSAGDRTKAMFAFDRNFRAVASSADAELTALYAGLLPVASAMQLGSKWRLPPAVAELRILPEDLDSLGPPVWRPNLAPEFRLPNHAGREIGLADYRGKPILVNFFLGVGCVFCAEQLNLFLPHLSRFREAGIEMVAISTDSVEVLQNALGKEEPINAEIAAQFPFPILSDVDGETFNAYGVVDDYGIGGMHATFLIDAEGRILWQDISRLPFEHPDALVGEATRLLGL